MDPPIHQQFVIPGDTVFKDDDMKLKNQTTTIKVGSGIVRGPDRLIATKASRVIFETKTNLWLDCRQRWYCPAVGDPIVGMITSKHADTFRVDIGSAHPATLSSLAFERTVKKNRPTFEVGDLVYACVSLADKDIEPEIQCIDKSGRNPYGFGSLKDGFLIRCSLDIARYFITPKCILISLMSEMITFEIAVGLNGRIWVNGSSRTIIFLNKVVQELHTSKNIKYDIVAAKAFLSSISTSVYNI